MTAETQSPPLIAELAFQFVEKTTGVSHMLLTSPRRQAELVQARALFVWIVRTYRPTASYPMIGRWLGGRDHSTIMHLATKAADLRLRDPEFDKLCERFAAEFRHHHRSDPYACN